jgi:uncharacterized membrane protein YcfT
MFPDTMNIVGVCAMVFLCLFCVFLTFQAWFDGRRRDLVSMRQHLRMIGISQLVIIFAALSIGTDIFASCKLAAEQAERGEQAHSIGRGQYSADTVLHASR